MTSSAGNRTGFQSPQGLDFLLVGYCNLEYMEILTGLGEVRVGRVGTHPGHHRKRNRRDLLDSALARCFLNPVLSLEFFPHFSVLILQLDQRRNT